MEAVTRIYLSLLEAYGPQGWWPLQSLAGKKPSYSKRFDERGYCPGSYNHPSTADQSFEIIVGAILTQNTAWINVEKAIARLMGHSPLTPKDLLSIPLDDLASLIRPAGYYNQKARRLHVIADFFKGYHDDNYLYFKTADIQEARSLLLQVKGVGPETADSILLYAFNRPSFVVDAYTKRVFHRLGLIGKDASYDQVQSFFHRGLSKDTRIFKEYHALIVEHSKRHCRSKAFCDGCPLLCKSIVKNIKPV